MKSYLPPHYLVSCGCQEANAQDRNEPMACEASNPQDYHNPTFPMFRDVRVRTFHSLPCVKLWGLQENALVRGCSSPSE